jgi:hypothetical protein
MRWRRTKLVVMMGPQPDSRMPTTFRFLLVIGTIAAAAYGTVFILANVLEPQPREITVTVPPARYAK